MHLESKRKIHVQSTDRSNVSQSLEVLGHRSIKILVDLVERFILSVNVCSCVHGGSGEDRRAAGFLDRRIYAGSNGSKESSTKSTALIRCAGIYRAVKYVCEHLSPELTLRTTAASIHGIDLNAQVIEDLDGITQSINNAFHNGTEHIFSLVHCGQTEEYATGIRIEVRCSLTHQVWQVQKTVSTDRYILSDLIEELVNIDTALFSLDHFCITAGVLEPLQGQACSLVNAHYVPAARNSGAECMYAALRVDLHIVSMSKYNTGSTEGCKCSSFFIHITQKRIILRRDAAGRYRQTLSADRVADLKSILCKRRKPPGLSFCSCLSCQFQNRLIKLL